MTISFQHIPFNVLIALSMLGIISCVSDIELDDGSEMPLVVNCVLSRSPESWYELEESEFWHPSDSEIPTQYLDLYRARRPSERTMQKIDDARVCVIDNNDIRHEFKWNGERWECKFLPHYGKRYELEIISAQDDTLKAFTLFPPRVRLASVSIITGRDMFYGRSDARYYYLQTYVERRVQDAPNYYHIEWNAEPFRAPCNLWVCAYRNDVELDLPILTNHPFADDFNVCKGSWNDFNIAEFQKEQFDGIMHSSPSFRPEDEELWSVYNENCSGSFAHHRYIRIHQTGATPSVMEEGTRCYWTYEGVEPLDSRLMFVLNADFDTESYSRGFVCRFASDEYDRYLRDVASKYDIHGDEFASYYSMDPVYSNIEGGKGIFGAMTVFKTDVYGF